MLASPKAFGSSEGRLNQQMTDIVMEIQFHALHWSMVAPA